MPGEVGKNGTVGGATALGPLVVRRIELNFDDGFLLIVAVPDSISLVIAKIKHISRSCNFYFCCAFAIQDQACASAHISKDVYMIQNRDRITHS